MNEVIQHQNNELAVVDQSSAVLAVISRAAADPNVDMDKLERLLDMQERIMGKQAETEFNAALAAMQAEIPSVAERGTGHNIKYATLEDIVDVVRPIMNKYGFAITFSVEQADKSITVVGELVHKGGHSKKTSMMLPHETSGSKNAVQAIGSSISYGKRYVLCAMLNIATRKEDDDGYAAVPEIPKPPISMPRFRSALEQMKTEPSKKAAIIKQLDGFSLTTEQEMEFASC